MYVKNLALLRPHAIEALHGLLTGEFSGWEMMVAVAVRGAGETWPDMGWTIRKNEIIDGL